MGGELFGVISETEDERAGGWRVDSASGDGSGPGADRWRRRVPAVAFLEAALRLEGSAGHGLVEAPEPFVAVEAAERLIRDVCGVLDQALAEAGAGLRRCEGLGFELVPPQAGVERLGVCEKGLDGFAAAGADEVVGVLACGKLDEAKRAVGPDVGERTEGGADRGLPARAVAVEAEDGRGVEAPHALELSLGH